MCPPMKPTAVVLAPVLMLGIGLAGRKQGDGPAAGGFALRADRGGKLGQRPAGRAYAPAGGAKARIRDQPAPRSDRPRRAAYPPTRPCRMVGGGRQAAVADRARQG